MDEYMLVFADGAHTNPVMEYFERKCKEAHFSVERMMKPQPALLVMASKVDLEVEATHMKLRKARKGGMGKEEFEIECREDFENVDSRDFFLPCERVHMTGVLLNALKVCMMRCCGYAVL